MSLGVYFLICNRLSTDVTAADSVTQHNSLPNKVVRLCIYIQHIWITLPLNDLGLFNMGLCGKENHKSLETSSNSWLSEQG